MASSATRTASVLVSALEPRPGRGSRLGVGMEGGVAMASALDGVQGPSGDLGEQDSEAEGTRGVSLVSFAAHCNKQRTPGDVLFYCYILACVVVALPRFRARLGLWDLATLLAFSGLTLAFLAWALVEPSLYCQRRELCAGAVRVLRWALPSRQIFLQAVLEANHWRYGTGPVGHLLFLLSFLCASAVAPLLHGPLACPLLLPWSALALAAEVGFNLAGAGALCACPAMQHPQARAAMHAAFTAFDSAFHVPWLGIANATLAGPGPGLDSSSAASPEVLPEQALPAQAGVGAAAAAAAPGQAPECWAVVAMLQLTLGFIVPVVLHAEREAAEFRAFWRRHRGLVRPAWCATLYRHSAGDRELSEEGQQGVGGVEGREGESGCVRRARLWVSGYLLLLPLWDIVAIMSRR